MSDSTPSEQNDHPSHGAAYRHVSAPNARFHDADFSGAAFDDVNLRGASFENVALDGARFRNVSLKGASVDDAALEGMTIDGVLVSELLRVLAASMPSEAKLAAVLYAKELPRMAAFYAGVCGLGLDRTEADHMLLSSAALQLSLVQIPAHIAADIHIDAPPRRREETPIKLAFHVPRIAAARVAAPALGGVIDAPEREWLFQGYKVCDGHDPEGNVVQLREREGAAR